MTVDSFSKFVAYRNPCSCGKKLTTLFSYSTSDPEPSMDGIETWFSATESYYDDEPNNELVFGLQMNFNDGHDGGVIPFYVRANYLDDTCYISTDYKSHLDINTIKTYFTISVQQDMKFWIAKGCSCERKTYIVSKPLTFHFYWDKGQVFTGLEEEQFRLVSEGNPHNKYYTIHNSYSTMKTHVDYSEGRSDLYLKRMPNILSLPLEKLQKYGDDDEKILKIIKTLLIFT